MLLVDDDDICLSNAVSLLGKLSFHVVSGESVSNLCTLLDRLMASWNCICLSVLLALISRFHQSQSVVCYTCLHSAADADTENCDYPGSGTATCTGGHCSYGYVYGKSMLNRFVAEQRNCLVHNLDIELIF